MSKQFHVAAVQTPAFSLDQAPAAARCLLQTIDEVCTSAPAPDLILLPECAYPAYFLAPCQDGNLDAYLKRLGAPTTDDFLAALAARARRHHTAIACGVALPETDGGLTAPWWPWPPPTGRRWSGLPSRWNRDG